MIQRSIFQIYSGNGSNFCQNYKQYISYFVNLQHLRTYFLKTTVDWILMLCMLGKNFSRQHFEIIFLFSPENRICHFMKTVSYGDSLHEMSNPFFLGKLRKLSLVYHLLHLPISNCCSLTHQIIIPVPDNMFLIMSPTHLPTMLSHPIQAHTPYVKRSILLSAQIQNC